MTVRFKASDVEREVELSNAKARIVLELLGRDGSGYLEGKMRTSTLGRKLEALGSERLDAAVVPSRQLGPDWVDHGTSRADLDEFVRELRELVREATERGTDWVRWS